MSQELFVGTDNKSLALEILANYLIAIGTNNLSVLKIKNTTQTSLKLPALPYLIADNGQVKTDLVEIASFISLLSGNSDILFGRTDEQIKTTNNFLSKVLSHTNDKNSLLEYLNQHLVFNTFCNGNNITVADIIAFGLVLEDVTKLDDESKNKYYNIVRWTNHIQSLDGIKDQIGKLKLRVYLPLEELFLEQAPVVDTKTKKQNTENKDKKEVKPKADTKKEGSEILPISKIDIRVGKIVKIAENTESLKLFNEEIDIGNGEIRKIASGLKGLVPIEDLQDSLVLVLCNLKERVLCGWPSHGMLLCAKDIESGKIEPLRPAAGSKPGDVVYFGDFPREPLAELPSKKSPWDIVKDLITVNEDKEAVFDKKYLWKTSSGSITTKSITNGPIS